MIINTLFTSNRISSGRTPEKVRSLRAEDLLTIGLPDSEQSRVPLQQLCIENLLSFGEMTKFDFGWLNVLVGPNGSGKSNLISCVRLLRFAPLSIQDAFSDTGFEEWLYKGNNKQSSQASLTIRAHIHGVSEVILHQLRFGTPVKSRTPLEEIVSQAKPEDESSDVYFMGSYRNNGYRLFSGATRRHRVRRLNPDEYNPYESILGQIRDVEEYPEITRLANLYGQFRIYSEWTFGRNSNLREATPTNRSSTTLSESMDDLALTLNGLENSAAHNKIRELLSELKETYQDFITRILFGRVGLELIEAPFATPLPAKRLSDGTLRFLALAAILLQPEPPPLICLEEPELGMHPDMIRMVARMIIDAKSTGKTQLIVSTHSEHLLTALQDEFDALFAFDAGAEGSFIRRFSQEEYKEWSQGNALGDLWTSGVLGGNRW